MPINNDALRKLFGSAWYNADRLKTELGFSPEITLESALPEIIAHYKRTTS